MQLKLLSLFSGIGAFEKALKNINIDFDVENYCEIDKYASKAYSAIHDIKESKNLLDVTKIKNYNAHIDILTYGFPCQDISNAGKQKGFLSDGEKTRSGLVFDALRIINDCKPKICICENVKALTSAKFKNEFNLVLNELNKIGYNNFYKILDAKNYEIPQHRERLFIISIRKDLNIHSFLFPDKQPLKTFLNDLLEENVNNSYFLNDAQIKRIFTTTYISAQKRIQIKNYCRTLCARDYKDPKCVVVDNKVRKLTPLEYWRLMGFTIDDFQKAKNTGISNSQLYKQAGNSVCVKVLEYIFLEIFKQVKF